MMPNVYLFHLKSVHVDKMLNNITFKTKLIATINFVRRFQSFIADTVGWWIDKIHTCICLKKLLQPEYYGDLVYRVRKIVGKSFFFFFFFFFSEQFRKLINRYNRIGHNLDIMRQTVCLVVNLITADSYVSSLIARRRFGPQNLTYITYEIDIKSSKSASRGHFDLLFWGGGKPG